jgi:co-chaperonin GroES (HSP10)
MSRTVITDLSQRLTLDQFELPHDYIMLQEMKRTCTYGGLALVGTTNSEVLIGKVLKVGRGIPNTDLGGYFPLEILPGEIVLTIQYMGERLKVMGEEYRMVREHGIWAKVKMQDSNSYQFEELEPRFACILVEPKNEERMASGLYFPHGQDTEAGIRQAIVISVGPGRWHNLSGRRIPCGVKPGEEICMTRFAGCIVDLRGRELRLIQENDIHCVIERT